MGQRQSQGTLKSEAGRPWAEEEGACGGSRSGTEAATEHTWPPGAEKDKEQILPQGL